jgi:hypothetical protein
MEDVKKDIFYKPSVNIDRDYSTLGAVSNEIYSEEIIEEAFSPAKKVAEKSEETVKTLIKIRKVLSVVPKPIQKTLCNIVDLMIAQGLQEQDELKKIIIQDKKDDEEGKYESIYIPENKFFKTETEENKKIGENSKFFVEISEKKPQISAGSIINSSINSQEESDNLNKLDSYETTDDIKEELEEDSSLNSVNNVDEDGFIWDDPEPTTYSIRVVKRKSNGLLSVEQYLRDSTTIKERFANNLNYEMQKYIYPLINMMDEIGISNPKYLEEEYEGKSIVGVDINSQHMHDTIVRNQTLIDEKSRLFNKTHGDNALVGIISSFDIASQQRVRYYSEEYDKAITSFLDTAKRNILEECRKIYEVRYNKAKANMYKYLNSTVILTSDILKNNLDACCAKCYLLSKYVNIFAKEELGSVGYTNSASSSEENLDNTGNNVSKATNTVN